MSRYTDFIKVHIKRLPKVMPQKEKMAMLAKLWQQHKHRSDSEIMGSGFLSDWFNKLAYKFFKHGTNIGKYLPDKMAKSASKEQLKPISHEESFYKNF